MIGLRLNNYEIISILGEGGMGTVYLARHTFTGRKAAVKLLHPQLAQDQVLVTRFMNEARATAAIGHPNIIDIIDVGFLPDGRAPYLMMELLQGESLAKRLQREHPLPIHEAIEIALPDRIRAFRRARRATSSTATSSPTTCSWSLIRRCGPCACG